MAIFTNTPPEYRSLKTYGREYIAEEKGSTIRGLLYAIPAAAIGGAGAYYLGAKLRPLAKKMPTALQKGIRSVMQMTDPGHLITPKTMNNPVIKGILKNNPDISRKELYGAIKETLSNPQLRLGLIGATAGGAAGMAAGNLHGGLRSIGKAEKESGYVPSTKRQMLGREIAGHIGGTVSTLVGIAAGTQIAKRMPTIPQGVRVDGIPWGKVTAAAKYIAAYGIPTLAGGTFGEASGKYLASRYMQNHRRADEPGKNIT